MVKLIMKILRDKFKDKNFFNYTKNSATNLSKSTNINILLNRVKSQQKDEIRKKFYFSFLASTGLILFGVLIF